MNRRRAVHWVFNPRWNLFDLGVWTPVVLLGVNGHPFFAGLLYFAGAVASVIGESAAEELVIEARPPA